jgi:o-succinylbenzoate synthase
MSIQEQGVKLSRATITPFALSLAQPLPTAHGTIVKREGLVLELFDSAGNRGLGEATPIPGFALESLLQAQKGLLCFLPKLKSVPIESIAGILDLFSNDFPHCYCALSALDTALCDLQAQNTACSLASLFCNSPQNTLPVNGLLSQRSLPDLAKQTRELSSQGFQTLKLKVGTGSLEDDLERVALVRNTAPDRSRLRLDANGSWNLSQAKEAITRFSTFDIEYIEQPMRTDLSMEFSALKKHSAIALALDESVTANPESHKLINKTIADVLILKPAALGGPHRTIEIARRAEREGLAVVVTSLLDGGVGRMMASQLAAALYSDNFSNAGKHACGLATGSVLKNDITDDLLIKQGFLHIPDSVGLGIQINPKKLDAVASGRKLTIDL